MLRLPAGVWIVGGEQRPERWLGAPFELHSARWPGCCMLERAVEVAGCEVVDLGELRVPAPMRVGGVLVDVDRTPLAAALVSMDTERVLAIKGVRSNGDLPEPGPNGAGLLPGEARTDGAGRFELELPWRETREIAIRTPDGRRQIARIAPVDPGASRTDLQLVMRGRAVLSVALLEGNGRLAGVGGSFPVRAGAWFAGAFLFVPEGGARVHLSSVDGGRVVFAQLPDDDGLLRLTTEVEPADVRAVDILVAGYRPVTLFFPNGAGGKSDLRAVLQPLPRIPVRLAWADARAGGSEAGVTVEACRIPPEEMELDEKWVRCCGFGSGRFVTLEREAIAADVFVQGAGKYWLYVYGTMSEQRLPMQVHGPFSPGDERVELTLERSSFVSREALERPRPGTTGAHDTAQGARSEERALGEAPRFVARFELQDGAPLAEGTFVGAFVGAVVGSAEGRSTPWAAGRVDADGRLELRGSFPSSFRLLVSAGLRVSEVVSWQPDVEQTVRLAAVHEVEVVVGGVRGETRTVPLYLRANIARDDARFGFAALSHHNAWIRSVLLAEAGSDDPALRRFRVRLAAGSYTLVGGSSFRGPGTVGVEEIRIEVAAVEGVQRFDVPLREF